MKKFLALVLSLCMVFSLAAVASAAEIDADGGSGSTPVYLSSTADGSIGGDPAPTAMSVTIPTGLPLAMSQSGDVTTADNCQIVNHSYGAVRVRSVSISAVDGWKLTAFGDKSSLAHEKVDSDKLGFALSIGGGAQVQTAPMTGCYLSGVGDASGNAVDVAYAAIVTPLSQAVTNATVANVVFVVEWDT